MSRYATSLRIASSVVAFVFASTYASGGVQLAEAAERALKTHRSEAKLHDDLKREAEAAEQKRQKAVAELRKKYGPDPAKVAKVKAEKARIEALHPNAKLEALSGQLESLAKDPHPTKSRLFATQKLMEQVQALPHVKSSPKLSAALNKGQGSLKLASKTGKTDALPKALDAKKPAVIRPTASVHMVAMPRHEPRVMPAGMHGELSPEMRELYAQAEGAWVETELGRVSTTQLAMTGEVELPGTEVASTSDVVPLLEELSEGALSPPTAADTAETIDAKLSPEITALAAQLNHDPLQIFNWVHDHVESETYDGSKKGAAGALAELRGNDVDQSSLLIALLRASGFRRATSTRWSS